MKIILASLFLISSSFAFDGSYPTAPDLRLTPGSLCQSGTITRYPERIKYCKRDVSQGDKRDVFDTYREALGYSLPGQRADYKIDHFIPLCAGGSNQKNNLWPQHRTVYEVTDPMEGLGCEKLSLGKISQKALIQKLKAAKYDHSLVQGTIQFLNAL
jgi:hypothetical protein